VPKTRTNARAATPQVYGMVMAAKNSLPRTKYSILV